MKSYRQFIQFVAMQKYLGTMWTAIRADAIKSGFKGWLFDLYAFIYHNNMIFCIRKQAIKNIIKKTAKAVFYVVLYFGLFVFGLQINELIKSATTRNKTETLALVVDTCQKAPKLCEYTVKTAQIKFKKEAK